MLNRKTRKEIRTYVVQVRLHVDEGQGFLQKDDEHATGDPIVIKTILIHVCFLRKHERRVRKT